MVSVLAWAVVMDGMKTQANMVVARVKVAQEWAMVAAISKQSLSNDQPGV